jgi:hypothetical protein
MIASPLKPGRAAAPGRTLASVVTRAALAGAVLAGAGLLAACGTKSSAASPGGTVTVTRTVPGTPSSSAPAPPTSTSAPAGPAPCPTRSLRVDQGLAQGTAGSVYQVIDFTNISSVRCTLYGYPGVAFAGGSPVHQIGAAADENPATARQLVTLAPGAVANALLRIVDAGNFPARTCGPLAATYLQIYPPNQTTPIYLSYSSQACSKPVHLLTVNVVVPGSGG